MNMMNTKDNITITPPPNKFTKECEFELIKTVINFVILSKVSTNDLNLNYSGTN